MHFVIVSINVTLLSMFSTFYLNISSILFSLNSTSLFIVLLDANVGAMTAEIISSLIITHGVTLNIPLRLIQKQVSAKWAAF